MAGIERRPLRAALRALGITRFARLAKDAVVVGPTASAVLVEPGDDQRKSGVRRADNVTVMGELGEDIEGWTSRPVHLLLHEGEGYVGLGGLRLIMYGGGPGNRVARFQIEPPLSREMLLLARPRMAPTTVRPSREWLTLVESDPIGAMCRFVETWHGPLLPAEGVAEEELAAVKAPDALAALWRIAGRCPRVLYAQNQISSFDRFVKADNSKGVVFYIESQGVFTAKTASSDPDPEVILELGDAPQKARNRLSGYLLQAALFEAILGASHGAFATSASRKAREAIVAPLTRLPLGAWHWPGDPAEFWVGDGVLAFTNANPPGFDVVVAAKDRPALEWLLGLDVVWDRIDA